jgi:hypothetical protein
MRMTRLIPLVLAGTAALAAAAAPVPSDKPVLPWIEDDYGRALAEARAKKVPIFAEAWAPW